MGEFECRLKKYRQLKELTQEQLAEKVGVRRETIMRLEKAQYNPSLKLAVDISRALVHLLKRFSYLLRHPGSNKSAAFKKGHNECYPTHLDICRSQ